MRTWSEAELIELENLAQSATVFADDDSVQARAGYALRDCVRGIRRLKDRVADLEVTLGTEEEISRG